jgi:WD40 repeat protein
VSPERSVFGLEFSPDGKLLEVRAIGSKNGTRTVSSELWDADEGSKAYQIKGETTATGQSPDLTIAFSRDRKLIAIARSSRQIDVVSTTSGRRLYQLDRHTSRVNALVFSADATRLISGSTEGEVILWNLKSRQPIRTHKWSDVVELGFFADGTPIATTPLDSKGIRNRWNLRTGERFGSKSGLLITIGSGDDVETISVEPQNPMAAVIRKPLSEIAADWRSWFRADSAFSPNRKKVAVSTGIGACLGGGVFIWDLAEKGDLATARSVGSIANSRPLAISPDGDFLASVMRESLKTRPSLQLESVSTRKRVFSFQPPKGVSSAAFSPDSRTLALIGPGGMLLLHGWRLPDFGTTNFGTTKEHWGPVSCLSFSTDGKKLASSSTDGTVCLWNPGTGKRVGQFDAHRLPVKDIEFSPDGHKLASASYNDGVALWDTRTGNELRRFKRPSSQFLARRHSAGRRRPRCDNLGSGNLPRTSKVLLSRFRTLCARWRIIPDRQHRR